MLAFLEGKKTYIAGAIGVFVGGLYMIGVLTGTQLGEIVAILGPVGFITLRHGVEVTGAEIKAQVAAQQAPVAPAPEVEAPAANDAPAS